MTRPIFPLFIATALTLSTACAQKDTEAPRIVETFPANGSQNVDPSLQALSVTFNEEMMDQNWSWAYTHKDAFPEMTGQPYYQDKNRKNVLPVRLQANKQYVIWLNSKKFANFKDKNGNPLAPVKFTFKTR